MGRLGPCLADRRPCCCSIVPGSTSWCGRACRPLLPSEQKRWPLARLQMMRANILLQSRADWQRATLRRLDRAQELANRLGTWSRRAFVRPSDIPTCPGAWARFDPKCTTCTTRSRCSIFPSTGPPVIPAAARDELTELFAEVKEPRPEWLAPDETWPPPVARSTTTNETEHRPSAPVGRASLQNGLPSSNGSATGGEVFEPGQVLEERQLDAAGRPVAVLGDDQLGDSRLVVGVVVFGTMEEEDHVGILFDRA